MHSVNYEDKLLCACVCCPLAHSVFFAPKKGYLARTAFRIKKNVVKLADFLKDCPCAQRELVCVCCPLEPLVFFVSKKYALPGLRKKW